MEKKLLNIAILITLLFIFCTINANTTNDSILNINKVGPQTEQIDQSIYEKIFYVSVVTGSNKNGDGSPENPWQTVFYALSEVKDASDSNHYAVSVAAGIYDMSTIIMKEYVDLYGGYNPQTWERDIFEYTTILDGKDVRRVVVGANHSRIDGFTITHGLGRSHGGGILCEDSSPTISNNFIIENLVLEPDKFNTKRIHQEGFHGGGIACLYNAVPIIKNNIICGNRTAIGYGGGIVFYGWVRLADAPETRVIDNVLSGGLHAIVENNVLFGNISGVNDTHDTRSSSGGAIACAFEACPVIKNNIILENQAKGRSDAGGIYSEYFSYPLIQGNWIVGNICDDDGGGIYVMKLSHTVITENVIAGNWTTGGGVGGIRISKEGRARILKNLIVDNPGGGVRCVDSYMELVDNIIMHNNKASGLTFSSNFSYMMPSLVKNNVIRENEVGAISILNNAGKTINLANNNIDEDSTYPQSSNFNKDPGFIDDGIERIVTSINYDNSHYTTVLIFKESIENREQLPGRLMRLGHFWGVIKETEPGKLVVWGNLSGTKYINQKFKILPSYKKSK